VPGLAALPWDLPHKRTPHIPFERGGRARGKAWGDGAGERKKGGGALGRGVATITAAYADRDKEILDYVLRMPTSTMLNAGLKIASPVRPSVRHSSTP
jgi:hypothetical protein